MNVSYSILDSTAEDAMRIIRGRKLDYIVFCKSNIATILGNEQRQQ